jgi:hypothetical protein
MYHLKSRVELQARRSMKTPAFLDVEFKAWLRPTLSPMNPNCELLFNDDQGFGHGATDNGSWIRFLSTTFM